MKNKIKLLGIIALTAIMGLSMIACDVGGSKGPGKIRNIDIVGAKALMIAPASSVSRSARASDGDVFLKQLDDGSWVQVKISDEEGNEIKTLPDIISDIGGDWMVIRFITDYGQYENGSWWDDYDSYLVRKTNGDAYDITPIGSPWEASFDKNGNVYYLSLGMRSKGIDQFTSYRVVKVTPGSTQATAEWLTPDLYSIFYFAADNDGNIMYSYNEDYFRIRTATGTTLPLDDLLPQGGRDIFNGPDGEIYGNFLLPDETGYFYTYTHKVTITGDTLDDITITPVQFDIVNGSAAQAYFDFRGSSGTFYSTDKLLVFSSSRILSISKDGSAKCVYLTESIGAISNITLGSKDFFIRIGNRIATVDPDTGTVTTLVPSTMYDLIYRYEVSSSDIITINALTFDGKDILANIYPDGRTVILSESFSENETLTLIKVR